MGILGKVPSALEAQLFSKFDEIERNYREHRWEPSELNGGKLCEVAYSIIRGHADGSFPSVATKPSNFVLACRDMEKEPSALGRSIRIQIPRMLMALYEVRNNRGVGHVGGEVNPNQMDAICVLHMSKWIVAEFVRIFHGVSTQQATDIVDVISQREIPLIWETGKVRRVLDNKLTMLEKTLVLLYASSKPLEEKELVKNLEHSNVSIYRRDVLRKAHKRRLLEYNPDDNEVIISPLGMLEVEENILPKTS